MKVTKCVYVWSCFALSECRMDGKSFWRQWHSARLGMVQHFETTQYLMTLTITLSGILNGRVKHAASFHHWSQCKREQWHCTGKRS